MTAAAVAAGGLARFERDEKALALAADLEKGVSGFCSFLRVDVCDEPAVIAAIEAMGPVDVLVNNAGIARSRKVLETPTKELEDILAINLVGAFVVMREIARGMVENGGGLIINVASDAAIIGIPGMGPYCASKHGLLGMGRSFSLELREQGLRVTTICPGPITTDIMGEGTANQDYMDPGSLADLLVSIAALDPRIEIQDLLTEPMPPRG